MSSPKNIPRIIETLATELKKHEALAELSDTDVLRHDHATAANDIRVAIGIIRQACGVAE